MSCNRFSILYLYFPLFEKYGHIAFLCFKFNLQFEYIKKSDKYNTITSMLCVVKLNQKLVNCVTLAET